MAEVQEEENAVLSSHFKQPFQAAIPSSHIKLQHKFHL
jgi:hypothetical protein